MRYISHQNLCQLQLSFWTASYVVALIAVLLAAAGCSSTRVSTIFHQAETNSPHALLYLDNKTHVPLMVRAPLIVKVDGQPVEKDTLRSGITQLRLTPGRHTITHTGQDKNLTLSGWQYSQSGQTPVNHFVFNPVTTEFTVEAEKSYRIVFRLDYWVTSLGYLIDYEGWDNAASARWPKKNIGQRGWE